jgi:phage terminase small subunit
MIDQNVVHPFPERPEPPDSLDTIGAHLWRTLLTRWKVTDPAELVTLEHACAAHAMAERLRKVVAAEGDTVEGAGGGTRSHPLIALELQARAQCVRQLDKLGMLDGGKPKRPPGRPPGGGW